MKGSETLAAKATFFFTAACILGWSAAMTSKEWVAKRNAYYRLTAGLFTVDLEKGYIGSMARFMLDPISSSAVSWLSMLVEAQYWLQDFREHMCSLPKIAGITDNVCGVSQHLVFASLGLLLCVWVSFAAMLSGSALIYRYVYVRPRAVLRIWSRIAYASAMVLQFGGLAQYVFAASRVVEMFPRMSGAHYVTHSVLFGAVASFMSVCALFVLVVLLGKSTEEEFNEAVSEQRKLIREDPELYGSAGLGGAPPAAGPAELGGGAAFYGSSAFGDAAPGAPGGWAQGAGTPGPSGLQPHAAQSWAPAGGAQPWAPAAGAPAAGYFAAVPGGPGPAQAAAF